MQNSALKGLEEKFYACWFLTDDACWTIKELMAFKILIQ
jgi:hypothetical protein